MGPNKPDKIMNREIMYKMDRDQKIIFQATIDFALLLIFLTYFSVFMFKTAPKPSMVLTFIPKDTIPFLYPSTSLSAFLP